MQVTGRQYYEAALTGSTLMFARYFHAKRFRRRYIAADHHVQIAEALDRVLRGEVSRLMINIFPRSGKTELAVKNFVALGFAINPASKFIHLTYSNDLALDNSEEIRDEFIRNDEYRRIFPYVEIDKSSTAKNKWYTTAGGGMYAAAAGGAITGFGAGEVADISDEELAGFMPARSGRFAGAIIIDDPLKPDDAFSQTQRDRVNRRWLNTIKSRLNSVDTPVIVIGQRLHPEDFCGYILDMEGDEWELLNLPALYKDEQGEYRSIWEAKMPIAELLKLKAQDEYTFLSQYQQEPTSEEGMLFPKSELLFYEPSNFEFDNDCYSVLIIDPADTGGDCFAAALGYVIEGEIYIDRFLCNNTGLAANIPASVDMATAARPSHIRIEGNGGWVQTARDIRDDIYDVSGDADIYIYKQKQNKEERIMAQAYFVKNRVHFRNDYERFPDYEQAIKTITSYMRGKKDQKDDAIDVLTEMVTHCRRLGLLN